MSNLLVDRRRMMMQQADESLPGDYQRVTYLQSGGNPYLLIDYRPQNIDSIHIRFSTANYRANNILFGRGRIGSEGTYDSHYWGDRVYWYRGKSNDNVNFFYLNSTYNNVVLIIDDTVTSQWTLSKADGTILTNRQLPTNIVQSSIDSYFGIFAAVNGNKVSKTAGTVRIYEFTIYRNGKVLHNFIPCYRKADNEPGMYDLKKRIFHTNSGTGTFGKGADVYE